MGIFFNLYSTWTSHILVASLPLELLIFNYHTISDTYLPFKANTRETLSRFNPAGVSLLPPRWRKWKWFPISVNATVESYYTLSQAFNSSHPMHFPTNHNLACFVHFIQNAHFVFLNRAQKHPAMFKKMNLSIKICGGIGVVIPLLVIKSIVPREGFR